MFSDLQIRQLKPKDKPYKYYEKASDKGFHVQISPSGRKVFYLAYTLNGKKRFYNLGTYSTTSKVAEARKACREATTLVERGIDPQVEHHKRKQQQELERQNQELERNAATINEVLDYYLTTLTNDNTRKNTTSQFNSDVRPAIGKIKARVLTDDDAEAVIRKVVDRGAKRSARNLYIALNAAFNKARKIPELRLKGWENPLLDIDKPAAGDPGDCTLTAEQIKSFWLALDDYEGMEPALKDALRILLLTGQRVKEILEMRWTEVNLDDNTLDIPPDRIKTGKKTRRGHIVPLTPMVADIIKRQPIQGEVVFPGRKDANTSYHWQSLSTALARMIKNRKEVSAFSPRDIRRTVKTHMARIKVMKEVRDRIQNHSLNDIASTHYDRYDYLDEKREGLQRWENDMKRIIGEALGGNVLLFKETA